MLSASCRDEPVAVAARTRPPEVRSSNVGVGASMGARAVPAWKIFAFGGGGELVMRASPLAYLPGYPPATATTVAENLGEVEMEMASR